MAEVIKSIQKQCPFFKAHLDEDILFIDFHKPESLNSFSIIESKALKNLSKIKASAIVFFSSHPRYFCSGGDLKYYATHSKSQGLKTNQEISKNLEAFAKLPFYKIAVVNGDCLGGGLEFLSYFDKILATPSARFALWQARIGLSFGWGAGQALARRIGINKLKQLSLSSDCIDAYQAENIDLVDQVIFAPHALDFAKDYAKKFLKQNPNSRREYLKFFQENQNNYKKTKEKQLFSKLWFNPFHKNLLEKFLSKN